MQFEEYMDKLIRPAYLSVRKRPDFKTIFLQAVVV